MLRAARPSHARSHTSIPVLAAVSIALDCLQASSHRLNQRRPDCYTTPARKHSRSSASRRSLPLRPHACKHRSTRRKHPSSRAKALDLRDMPPWLWLPASPPSQSHGKPMRAQKTA